MRRIENIGSETTQRHTILYLETELVLLLRYYPTIQQWTLGIEYKQFKVFGLGLSCGVLHMESRNQPFDFVVQDNSGNGLDPFKADDFSSGRCSLYLVEADEIEAIREQPVPI